MSDEARRAAERAARTSYGRLIAILAARGRDIASAEDALSDAFAAALRNWPDAGVPACPDAWLLTAARRNLGHARGRAATAAAGMETLALLEEERADARGVPFGDDRLKLMFVCAHPAIEAGVQAPLMLQTVLGIDAARIAASFLVSPAAMGRNLGRAKAKIRDAGIGFAIPDADQTGERVQGVLAAIYAAYGTGWEDVLGAEARIRGLSDEAIWLARLVVELRPDDPEALGLLALTLHCEARRRARRDADGGFLPLYRQDPRHWDRRQVGEAEAMIRAASAFAAPGRFQIEAAIQSYHVQAVVTGRADPAGLVRLYDVLVSVAPSTGARVARAAANAEAGHLDTATAELTAIADRTRAYQPWWAAQARLLHLLSRPAEAAAAARVAAGLSADPAVRHHLLSGGLFERR